ncbi:M16 family peptidase, putative, partial [Eimeria tenella]
IRFLLTEKGLKDESIAYIGEMLFLYLRAIRMLGVEEWRYAEMAAIRRQQFRFADMADAYDLSQAAAEGKQQEQQQQQRVLQQQLQQQLREQLAAAASVGTTTLQQRCPSGSSSSSSSSLSPFACLLSPFAAAGFAAAGFAAASAAALQYYPVKEVLAGPSNLYLFNKELIVSLIDHYLGPHNLRLFLLHKQQGRGGPLVEPRYQIRYSREPLGAPLLARWGALFSLSKGPLLAALQQHGLSLPGPNPYLLPLLQQQPVEQQQQQQQNPHPTRLLFPPGHLCNPSGHLGGPSHRRPLGAPQEPLGAPHGGSLGAPLEGAPGEPLGAPGEATAAEASEGPLGALGETLWGPRGGAPGGSSGAPRGAAGGPQ